MREAILILFAAGVIYYVAIRVAPQGFIFKLKKDEPDKTAPQEEPKTEVTPLTEGQTLFNKGMLEQAEKKFLEVIKNDPKEPLAYHFLGMIYLRQELHKGAIASLEKAVNLNPINDTAFNNLGLAYLNTGNIEKAIENFEKSISLNDKIAHRYLNLALAYQEKKNWEKAAVALESAVRIHENVENLTLLSKNYLSMGDKKLAEKNIEKILLIEPENAWAKRQKLSLVN